VKATGMAEPDCATAVGISATDCDLVTGVNLVSTFVLDVGLTTAVRVLWRSLLNSLPRILTLRRWAVSVVLLCCRARVTHFLSLVTNVERSLAKQLKIETPVAKSERVFDLALFVVQKLVSAADSGAEQLEDLTEAEKREAEVMAAAVVRAYFPSQHFPGLDERVPPMSLKRDAGTQILDNLQICSPLIALGISLLASEVTLPINITDIVGPCGFACNVALCALNLLCADEAAPLLVSVRAV
jgi:hypothetical protein